MLPGTLDSLGVQVGVIAPPSVVVYTGLEPEASLEDAKARGWGDQGCC